MVLTFKEELLCRTLFLWCGASPVMADVEESEHCIFISPIDYVHPARFFYRLWRPFSYLHLRNIVLNVIVSADTDTDIEFWSESVTGIIVLKLVGFVDRQVTIDTRYTHRRFLSDS